MHPRLKKAIGPGLGLLLVAAGLAAGVPALGTTRSAQSSVSSVTATVGPAMKGSLGIYTVKFKTSGGGSLAVGQGITVQFPAGTNIVALASYTNNITVNGVTTSALSIDLVNKRVVARVPVPIGALGDVTVVLGSATAVITNPTIAGSYQVKVFTAKDLTLVGSTFYSIFTPAPSQIEPVAQPDGPITVQKNIPILIDVLANDQDANGDARKIITKTNGHGGKVTIVGGAGGLSVIYTPNPGFVGADSFTYTISDYLSGNSTGTVTLSVVNSPPVAGDDDISIAKNSGANVLAVLANDIDANADSLTITSKTNPASGTLTITGLGKTLTYTPALNFTGDVIFTYTVSDGMATDTATVIVHVLASITFDLCAKTGSLTLPDATIVDIWGYALKPAGVGCSDPSVEAGLPGPVLNVPKGIDVTIKITNELAEETSLLIPGMDLPVGSAVAAPGDTLSFSFMSGTPGTFLYESASDAKVQVPMGLYGALVVRGPGNIAYGSTTGYGVEAVLVLSEIDPALHADPAGFSILDYDPAYFLINGKAYPDTTPIMAGPGTKVLLRYLNAGLLHHSMEVLGTYQKVVAKDAYPLTFPYDAVSETVPTGGTEDTIATVPSSAASGQKFWVYERNLHVDNVNTYPGGMLVPITVP